MVDGAGELATDSNVPLGRSTVSSVLTQSRRTARRGRWWRRVTVLAVAAFVLAGLVNVWGPRTGVAVEEGETHRITVSAPSVSRGGLAAMWELNVRRMDGAPLARRIDVEVDQQYLDVFDQHAIEPRPDESWTDGDTVYWRFQLPADVTEFTVSLDGRVQPDVRWRHRGATTVHIEDESITAHSTTWLLP